MCWAPKAKWNFDSCGGKGTHSPGSEGREIGVSLKNGQSGVHAADGAGSWGVLGGDSESACVWVFVKALESAGPEF